MNRQELILSPTGRPLWKMGEHAHKQFTTGDYCVSIEWYIEARECEPVMVIWPKYFARQCGAFAICLSSAAKYADPNGGPSAMGLLEAWKALPTLGRNQIDMEAFRLMDVILRHMPDLLTCPPVPPAVRQAETGEALLEVTTKDQDGKTIREVVI